MMQNSRNASALRLAFAVLFAGVLAGCSTPYQNIGLAGGHRDSLGPGHLERVDFSGNGFSEPGQMKVFALYRAAEVAQQKKKPFFVLYDSLISAAQNRASEMPRVGTLGGKPWAYAFVRFHDKKVAGANDTAEVLRLYQDAVKSPVVSQK